MEAAATAVMSTAAGLLLYAVKRAALGDRPLVASVVCFLRDSHNERKQAMGGSRCMWCGAPFADLGSVAPLRTQYDRKHGEITRSEWR